MRNPFVFLIGGLLFLGAGALLAWSGGPQASSAAAELCREELRSRGPEAEAIIAQCEDPAFASAITATDVRQAARSIGSANRAGVAFSALSMALLGIGTAVTAIALIRLVASKC